MERQYKPREGLNCHSFSILTVGKAVLLVKTSWRCFKKRTISRAKQPRQRPRLLSRNADCHTLLPSPSLALASLASRRRKLCSRDEQKHILSSYPVKRIIHRQVKATESAVVFSRDSVFIGLYIIYKRFDSPDNS